MEHSQPRRLAFGAALALVLVAAIPASLGAPGARAMGPLPACRYDDILTTPRLYTDWSITLVDTILRVRSTYVPPDLVSVANAGIAGSGKVRKVALADLTAMTKAARAAGAPIAVESAYRSFSQQKTTFQGWVDKLGYKAALKVSARPGHSEHQLGLAIDFRSDKGGPPWEGTDWALSPAGKWMKANAWTFGWVMSYPKDSLSTVCYSYEPWHYRYVGKSLAKSIHDSKLTIREYLWANFTTAVVPASGGSGSPAASGSAAPAESPIPSPSEIASPSTSASLAPLDTPLPATPSPIVVPTAAPNAVAEFLGGAGGWVLAAVVIGAIAVLAIGVALAGNRARARRR